MPYVMTLIDMGAPIEDQIAFPDIKGVKYLKSFDPDGYAGRGNVVQTTDIKQAKRYSSLQELFTEWKRPSKIVPYRPDGKPNRPLTAYSMTPVTVEE